MNNKFLKLALANMMALLILVGFNPENIEVIEAGDDYGIEVLSDREGGDCP